MKELANHFCLGMKMEPISPNTMVPYSRSNSNGSVQTTNNNFGNNSSSSGHGKYLLDCETIIIHILPLSL